MLLVSHKQVNLSFNIKTYFIKICTCKFNMCMCTYIVTLQYWKRKEFLIWSVRVIQCVVRVWWEIHVFQKQVIQYIIIWHIFLSFCHEKREIYVSLYVCIYVWVCICIYTQCFLIKMASIQIKKANNIWLFSIYLLLFYASCFFLNVNNY